MAGQALLSQPTFVSREELAQACRRTNAFDRARPGAADLLAATTLRPANGGTGFRFCCPPAYEAQMLVQVYDWVIAANLDTLRRPVKVTGAIRWRCSRSFRLVTRT